MNYAKYGFNPSLKQKLFVWLNYLIIFTLEIVIAVLVWQRQYPNYNYLFYLAMEILLLWFFLLFFQFDIRKFIYYQKMKKAIQTNLAMPNDYTFKYFVGSNTKTHQYEVLFLAYNKENDNKEEFLFTNQMLLLARDRFGDVVLKNPKKYNLANFLLEYNPEAKLYSYQTSSLSYYCKNKKFTSLKRNVLSSILYSVFTKIIIFVIILVIFTLSMQLINGILFSTLAMFGFDKVINLVAGLGNVQIKKNIGVESIYTIVNVGSEEYVASTKEVKFLYEDFSDNERNTR